MAIAFDSKSSVNAATSTSLTYAFNNVAGDCVVVFCHDTSGASSTVTGVTYGGVAMTQVGSAYRGAGGGRWITAWILAAPATGSNNVVVSSSSSQNLRSSAYSYSGVDQSTPLDANNTAESGTGTTWSNTLTTVADNAWMIVFGKDETGNKTYSLSSSGIMRLAVDAGGHWVADSNGAISPAGPTTLNGTNANSNTKHQIALSIKPAGGAAPAFRPRIMVY